MILCIGLGFVFHINWECFIPHLVTELLEMSSHHVASADLFLDFFWPLSIFYGQERQMLQTR